MKIFVIGDTHIKHNNLPYIEIYIRKLDEFIQTETGDIIVLLGDILHDHGRLNTQALNKAYKLINMLSKKALTYILVGNHDMVSNSLFLTEDHWMNGLKHWEHVVVVDKIKKFAMKDGSFLVFAPYVPPGKFIEALETTDDWEDASIIFAHQEFKGCQMGPIKSEKGDVWSLDFPQVFTGHIHEMQTLQENIFYTGASTQTSFSEKNSGKITIVDYDDGGFAYESINIDLPRKRIINITCSEFANLAVEDFPSPEYVKIKISGTYIEFKKLKKTKLYKKFFELGIKIVYIATKMVTDEAKVYQTSDFLNLLTKEIEQAKNPSILQEILKSVI